MSVCQGLSLFAPGGGKMRDPGNEVATRYEEHARLFYKGVLSSQVLKPS